MCTYRSKRLELYVLFAVVTKHSKVVYILKRDQKLVHFRNLVLVVWNSGDHLHPPWVPQLIFSQIHSVISGDNGQIWIQIIIKKKKYQPPIKKSCKTGSLLPDPKEDVSLCVAIKMIHSKKLKSLYLITNECRFSADGLLTF